QTDAFLLKLGYETSTDEVINNSHFSAVNYPNPFNPTTTIEFSIQNDSEVKLIIFNIKGQIIKSLINEYLNIGKHSVNWDGCDNSGQSVGSGVYLYQIKTPTETITKRMLLLK
ncbi:MAG: T9SS type A sorting domain-containing protein, partial [Candidatus Tenebribacter burtonii]|nr:T9SS type A sorting domain-containing protein [Candidatus Tenebribacter burtonii]